MLVRKAEKRDVALAFEDLLHFHRHHHRRLPVNGPLTSAPRVVAVVVVAVVVAAVVVVAALTVTSDMPRGGVVSFAIAAAADATDAPAPPAIATVRDAIVVKAEAAVAAAGRDDLGHG